MTELQRPMTASPPPIIPNVVAAPTIEMRRFELPDLDHHPWIYERIAKAYPHIGLKNARNWLKQLLYMNEFNFLFQERAVACAQVVRPYGFTPDLVIWERFVWCSNPIDPEQHKEAASFYERFAAWGRGQDAQCVIVGEQSDVPYPLIKSTLEGLKVPCRVLERKMAYARL